MKSCRELIEPHLSSPAGPIRSHGYTFESAREGAVCSRPIRPVTRAQSIMTVDVEDWFHILGISNAPQLPQWQREKSCVERNFLSILDLFSERGARSTCFFLGWVAERFPHLVKEAARRGHEIASHGYAHQLTYRMSATEFLEDTARTRKLLEDMISAPVLGYRAPSFSLSEWFFDLVLEAGYKYDASVFPARRECGGAPSSARKDPHRMALQAGSLIECPMSVFNILGKPICFSGGGYLRLYPYFLIRKFSCKVLEQGRPVVFYVHPREIDPDHPRLAMNYRRRFMSYVNLHTTRAKLSKILDEFPVTTFSDYLRRNVGL